MFALFFKPELTCGAIEAIATLDRHHLVIRAWYGLKAFTNLLEDSP